MSENKKKIDKSCFAYDKENKTCVLVALGIGSLLFLGLIFVFLLIMFEDGKEAPGFKIDLVDEKIDCEVYNEIYQEMFEPNVEDVVLREELKRVYNVCLREVEGVSLPSDSLDIFRGR